MDGLQLRDEAVRDRVRAAQEFLDPRMFEVPAKFVNMLTVRSRSWSSSKLQIRDHIDAPKVSAKTCSQH